MQIGNRLQIIALEILKLSKVIIATIFKDNRLIVLKFDTFIRYYNTIKLADIIKLKLQLNQKLLNYD